MLLSIYLKSTIYRLAFFTNSDVQDGRERFLSMLSNSLGAYKLACQLSKSQLNKYMMKTLEQFYMQEEYDSVIAASNVGLQQKSGTWVFNTEFQIVEGESAEKYFWLGPKYCGKHSLHIAPSTLATSARALKAGEKPLQVLIKALRKCYRELTPHVLLTLASQILCVHYQKILRIAHHVPATILFGGGKSRTQECAASMVGMKELGIIRQLTTDLTFSDLSSRSSLGFALDDQSNVSILSEKILNHFDR